MIESRVVHEGITRLSTGTRWLTEYTDHRRKEFARSPRFLAVEVTDSIASVRDYFS